jgi:O-antigen polymerase family protein
VFGGFSFAQDALASLDMIFRKVDDLYYYRIRSVTAEASAFGMYSALLFPWLLNCILHDTGSKKIFFLTIFFYFLILNLLSFSRTSYVILTIEFILYVCFFFSSIIHRVRASIGYISIGGIIFGILYLKIGEELGIDIGQIFLSLTANDGPQAMSNVARYASTLAALEIWQEYPIFGCGLGAYGFYAPGYYPNWAWSSIEIVGWSLNTLSEGSWPLAHNMYARMLAETGALGAGLWGLIGLFLIYEIWGLLKYDVNKMYVKCLLISTVGILLCGFNSESLHFFAYWIILGMVWSYRLKKMLSVSYEIRE